MTELVNHELEKWVYYLLNGGCKTPMGLILFSQGNGYEVKKITPYFYIVILFPFLFLCVLMCILSIKYHFEEYGKHEYMIYTISEICI